jgi:hypothetical protein
MTALIKQDFFLLPGQHNQNQIRKICDTMLEVMGKLPHNTSVRSKLILSRRKCIPCKMCDHCATGKFKNCKHHFVAETVDVYRHDTTIVLPFMFDMSDFVEYNNIFVATSEFRKLTLIVKL